MKTCQKTANVVFTIPALAQYLGLGYYKVYRAVAERRVKSKPASRRKGARRVVAASEAESAKKRIELGYPL